MAEHRSIPGSKSELDPWRVIMGHLLELDSYFIPDIIDKTGMKVDWTLTEGENFSHKYRRDAFRPRINEVYNQLSEDDRLRVVSIVAGELANRGLANKLNDNLKKIGWQIDEQNRLIPIDANVRELFFPRNTPHDAYVEIRKIFHKASRTITIIDPYVGRDLLSLLRGVVDETNITQIRILTHKIPSDFVVELERFNEQHKDVTIYTRKSKSKPIHDRFIILDDEKCFHLGASIKDAGKRAFLISEIEYSSILSAIIKSLEDAWSDSEDI